MAVVDHQGTVRVGHRHKADVVHRQDRAILLTFEVIIILKESLCSQSVTRCHINKALIG